MLVFIFMSHPTIIIIGMPNCCLCLARGAPTCRPAHSRRPTLGRLMQFPVSRLHVSAHANMRMRNTNIHDGDGQIYAAGYDFRVNSSYNNPGCCGSVILGRFTRYPKLWSIFHRHSRKHRNDKFHLRVRNNL